jgi:hypothetical protein
MPWPQNSRTTEKPLRLGEALDGVADVAQAWRPGATCTDAVPTWPSVGDVAQPARRRCEGSPTVNMRLVSPWKPSLMTVMSMLTMSPLLQHLIARDAVADLVVDRGADRSSGRGCAGGRS